LEDAANEVLMLLGWLQPRNRGEHILGNDKIDSLV
jgi:hypothetical protein